MLWLDVGQEFPPKKDRARLDRYAEFRYWFDGDHMKAKEAQRISAKLAEAGHDDAVVYLVANLPKLHAEKFADLQILRTPQIKANDGDIQAAQEAIFEDNPSLWGEFHSIAQYRRGFGDGCFVTRRTVDETAESRQHSSVRIVDPACWFPVMEEDDPRVFGGHQVATLQVVTDEKGNEKDNLVVECYERGGRCTIKTFRLTSGNKHAEQKSNYGVYQIESLLDEVVQDPQLSVEGFLFHHIPNGKLAPDSPFGRSDYADMGSMFDEINTRLSFWASANDESAHPYVAEPERYLGKDEETGQVNEPNKWNRKRYSGSNRGDPAEKPEYIAFQFNADSAKDQFWTVFQVALARLQLAPALLGLQFGNEKESGEAKSLGMGTTEAAARRDLLYTAPVVNVALNVLLKLKGVNASVWVEWKVGLPKTDTEQQDEVIKLRNAGLLSQRGALSKLNPTATEEELEQLIAELDEERQAEQAAFSAVPA